MTDSRNQVKTPTETRYATIDLGSQSHAVAESISEGDTMTHDDQDHGLTITDVYAVPTSSEDAAVTVRTEIEGTHFENGTFAFGNTEFASGQNVSIRTDEYDVVGDIETVDDAGTDLSTTETTVRLEQTVPIDVAEAIETGDEVQLGDETTATVDTAAVYPVADSEYRVVVGATLSTLKRDDNDGQWYGNASVDVGATIPLSTNEYDFEPEILETGVTDEPGEPTTTTVEIDLDKLEDREAAQFEVGLTETAGDETWATITEVEREPASVIVESDDGDLHERQHPTKDDLTLTVELATRDTDRGLRFQGESLENGDTVYLDFDITAIEERVWLVND